MSRGSSRDSGQHGPVNPRFGPLLDRFVVVAGEPVSFRPETDADPSKIDHFYVTVAAGDYGEVRISLNTLSRKTMLAGLDARIRLGILRQEVERPSPGINIAGPLSYSDLNAAEPIPYSIIDPIALEGLLAQKLSTAEMVEAWGELHVRPDVGLHQVHSRQPSAAVAKAVIGRDGALRLFYRENAELLLFKFYGQE